MQASGQILPLGGVCTIQVTGIAGPPLVTSRAIGTGPFVVIDTQPQPGEFTIVVDPGVGLPGPLPMDQGGITYQLQDSATTLTLPALTPVMTLDVTPDWLDETVLRAFQAGMAALTVPQGYVRPVVIQEMPKVGLPVIPYLFFTPVSMEQVQTQIGQDVPVTFQTPGRQLATISVQARRTWHFGLVCTAASERDFYRDACLGMFQALLGSFFLPLGLDMAHSFRVQTGQQPGKNMAPGLYTADMLFNIEGMYNVGLVPTYGVINAVSGSISSSHDGLIASTAFYVTGNSGA